MGMRFTQPADPPPSFARDEDGRRREVEVCGLRIPVEELEAFAQVEQPALDLCV